MLPLNDGKNKVGLPNIQEDEGDDKLYAVGFIVTAAVIFGVLIIIVGVGHANNSSSKSVPTPSLPPSKNATSSAKIPATVVSPPTKTSTPTPTTEPTAAPTPTPNPTSTPTPTPTNTPTPIPTPTESVTPSPSTTISPTP